MNLLKSLNATRFRVSELVCPRNPPMAVAAITCDRCREPIEATERTLIHVATGPLKAHRPAVDLCQPCAADLVLFLNAGRPEPSRLV